MIKRRLNLGLHQGFNKELNNGTRAKQSYQNKTKTNLNICRRQTLIERVKKPKGTDHKAPTSLNQICCLKEDQAKFIPRRIDTLP